MLRCFRFIAIVGVLVFSASLHSQPVPNSPAVPVPETYFPKLQELIATAVRQSPRMIARNTDAAIAEAERAIARSAQLPSVGANATYYPWTQDERGDIGTVTTEKIGYNVGVAQPVFHWGALRDATRIGDLRVKITQGQTAEVYRALVGEIRTQYLQLIIKKLGVERARFAQRLADDALALARERFEKRLISDLDLFGPTIAAEQARLAADQRSHELEHSCIILGRLCGLPPIAEDDIPDAVPAVTPVSSELESIVAEFTGESEIETIALRNLRRQIEIEKLNYEIASDRLKPKVNAVAGVMQDEHTYSYGPGTNLPNRYEVQSFYTGIALNWPIFDGFAMRAAKSASLARRRQLERTYGEQMENLVLHVRAQKRQVDFTARSLAITEKYFTLGNTQLRTKEEDQKRGLVSPAELESARLQFMDTQINTFAARNDYLLRVAELLSATMNDPALANLPASLTR